eukprot:TRINITY_DN31346_c0_g1_i1.p1 TRINITY_DN31346_c0_g1~~TRINITY_DN31346_c0_g1_i1.p1  ORF type:complete len:351 (-),score=48.60 TRINITY_DN31346_c0_g1_i1:661-1713(-)
MESSANFKETELRLGPPGAASPVREPKNEDSATSSATSELSLLSPRLNAVEKKLFPEDEERQQPQVAPFWSQGVNKAGAKRGFSQTMEARKISGWNFSSEKLSVDPSKSGNMLSQKTVCSPKGASVWPGEHGFLAGSSRQISVASGGGNLNSCGSRPGLGEGMASVPRDSAAPKMPVTDMALQKQVASEGRPAPKAQVVGWPPIRSFRRNSLAANPRPTEDTDSRMGSNALYVKVSMEGAPYLRKVDLKMYNRYQDLCLALEKMFSCFTIGQYGSQGGQGKDGLSESKLIDLLNGSEYVLTYEDKDGDWMLVGDVPWQMFVDSCKKLKIMKSSEAIGLAPRAMEKCKSRG